MKITDEFFDKLCLDSTVFPSADALYRYAKELRSRLTQQTQQGTGEQIPMTERLPDIGTPVCCWFDERKIWVIDELYNKSPSDGGGVQFVVNYIHNYTHWQPLPPAPVKVDDHE